ncbi:hypothetical protein E2C01_050536 [Portunus trituberculatus]|uniref:Uncharacterized protein n=1 Tax=Portunus trituberculatus TaxID=210409 RepID=A0A5B7GGS2_PORTR|nr:hypothetical protein [Portunus trituberculatus]
MGWRGTGQGDGKVAGEAGQTSECPERGATKGRTAGRKILARLSEAEQVGRVTGPLLTHPCVPVRPHYYHRCLRQRHTSLRVSQQLRQRLPASQRLFPPQ